MNSININALVDLLKPEADSDSEDDKPKSAISKMGPGDINSGLHKPERCVEADDTKKNSKDIWDCDEVGEGGEYDDVDDPRPSPQYDIWYKQAVTSEDIYLQMGNKNPTTASCENMVVQVILPDTKLPEIDLDVKAKFLTIRSPLWRLALHLPHPVDPNSGDAKWDAAKYQLTVTLRMNREYDFMNM